MSTSTKSTTPRRYRRSRRAPRWTDPIYALAMPFAVLGLALLFVRVADLVF